MLSGWRGEPRHPPMPAHASEICMFLQKILRRTPRGVASSLRHLARLDKRRVRYMPLHGLDVSGHLRPRPCSSLQAGDSPCRGRRSRPNTFDECLAPPGNAKETTNYHRHADEAERGSSCNAKLLANWYACCHDALYNSMAARLNFWQWAIDACLVFWRRFLSPGGHR